MGLCGLANDEFIIRLDQIILVEKRLKVVFSLTKIVNGVNFPTDILLLLYCFTNRAA